MTVEIVDIDDQPPLNKATWRELFNPGRDVPEGSIAAQLQMGLLASIKEPPRLYAGRFTANAVCELVQMDKSYPQGLMQLLRRRRMLGDDLGVIASPGEKKVKYFITGDGLVQMAALSLAFRQFENQNLTADRFSAMFGNAVWTLGVVGLTPLAARLDVLLNGKIESNNGDINDFEQPVVSVIPPIDNETFQNANTFEKAVRASLPLFTEPEIELLDQFTQFKVEAFGESVAKAAELQLDVNRAVDVQEVWNQFRKSGHTLPEKSAIVVVVAIMLESARQQIHEGKRFEFSHIANPKYYELDEACWRTIGQMERRQLRSSQKDSLIPLSTLTREAISIAQL